MARKKAKVTPPAGDAASDIVATLESLGTLRIVQKQADRIYKLFQLPHDYPERDSAITRYQEALVRNGIGVPPATIHEAAELINQVGEFNG